MSTWHDRELVCAACATTFVVKVATGLHISRLPEVRERVVAGELHRFRCPSCAHAIEVRLPLIYTDFARGHWIEVHPATELANWRVLAAACDRRFHRAIDRGAPIVREQVGTFRVRIVFGYDELRDKIVVWDAGLDDVAVESAKLIALRADISLFGVDDRLLVRAVDGDRLIVDRHRGGAVDRTLVLPIDRASPAAVVFEPPFVSLNRAIGRFALD